MAVSTTPNPFKRQHLMLFPTVIELKSNEWQLFSPRLNEILSTPVSSSTSNEITEERKRLLKSAFPLWSRQDFYLFLYCCNHGKSSLQVVAAQMGKPLEEITLYHQTLMIRGPELFTPDTWSRILFFVNQSLLPKDDEVSNWQWKVRCKLASLEHKANKSSSHHLLGSGSFPKQEACLLRGMLDTKKTLQEIRFELGKEPSLTLDHFVRSLNAEDLEREVESLLVRTKHNEDDDNDDDEDDDYEEDWKEKEANIKEELVWLERSLQLSASSSLLFSPLSSPTTPRPNSANNANEDNDSDGGVHAISLDPRHHAHVLAVVLSLGTAGMGLLVNSVIRVLPEGLISKRQLKRDILCLAVKEKRAGDRAARWYPKNE